MIIHAVSIHVGGGKILLDHILKTEELGKTSVLICDSRYSIPQNLDRNMKIIKIKPNLISRWWVEFKLLEICKNYPDESVFFFSNLPPFFKHKNHSILFLQNALLLPSVPFIFDNIKNSARILYEKIYLRIFLKNINETWVQTSWMKEMLTPFTNLPIQVKPINPILPTPTVRKKKYDFICITSLNPHKRLFQFLQTWHEIPSSYSLAIISDSIDNETLNLIQSLKNVRLFTNVSRNEIFKLYEESKCLIVTSKIESYCLPIYEALHFGLSIIAPSEGYTADIRNKIVTYKNINKDEIYKAITLVKL